MSSIDFKVKIKSLYQNSLNFIKYEVFSKEYFFFTLNLTLRKWSIYCSFTVYLLGIISYTIIVPLITSYQPSYFMTLPITALLLVIIVAVFTAHITIEIFRTPIDDGTELLIISKPLHRSQIFFVKCTVLLILGLSASLISMTISCFSLIFSDSSDTGNVIGGIFLGTVLLFAVFGSIAIFCSMLSRKMLSLLITSAVAFIFAMISILGALTIDKSSGEESLSDLNVSTAAYMNVDENGKSSIVQGAYYSGSSSTSNEPSQIYQNYFSTKIYPKFAYADFATQLSSMFMLDQGPKDIINTYKLQTTMNVPYKLVFGPVETFDDSFSGTSLDMVVPSDLSTYLGSNSASTSDNTSENQNDVSLYKFLYVTPYSSSITSTSGSSNKYHATIDYSYYDYQKTTVDDESLLQFLVLLKNNFDSYLTGNQSSSESLSKRIINYFTMIDSITEQTLTDYFETSLTNSTSVEAVKKLNQIIYTAIYYYFVQLNGNNLNLLQLFSSVGNSSESYDFYTVIEWSLIRLLSIDMESGLQVVESYLNQNQSGYTLDDLLSVLVNNAYQPKIDFTINDQAYTFKSAYQLSLADAFTNFQVVHMESLYNPYLLFICWIIFSAIFNLISLAIYRKKDFK